MTKLSKLLKEHLYAHESPSQTARIVMRKLSTDDLIEAVLPLVRDSVVNLRRADTRQLEDSVLSRKRRGKAVRVADPVGDRKALLECKVFCGERGYIAWGDVTVEDLKIRIEYLTVQLRGVQKSIKHCKEAIRRIEDAGVTTLGEIEADDLKKELAA